MLATRDTIISTLQKDIKDNERLIKLLRNEKQILSDKNADLRSGNIPKTVKDEIVTTTLKGKHSHMTYYFNSVIFIFSEDTTFLRFIKNEISYLNRKTLFILFL